MLSMKQRVRQLSREDRQTYETLAEQFESGWQQAGGSPSIAPLLPSGGPVRLPLLVHLAKCDMEFRWRRGQRLRVEHYQERFPELLEDAGALLELLLCEYSLARREGADPDDFVRRLPDARLEKPFRAAAAEREPLREWVDPPEFEVQEEVGRGGWGVVYRAKHRRLGRVEAIKRVDPRLASGRRGQRLRALIQRLRKEIPAAARLNHPNIVHLYYDGESNGHPYFVMEFCAGGSLQKRLAGKPMPAREAARLLGTLAEAMDAVHRFGLIHRDLKPSNILFGQGDVPKIADFGLASSRIEGEEDTSPPMTVGTPAYMAPEQIDPAYGQLGPTTDVYGLGAILYECLTGQPPFQGDSVHEIYGHVLRDPVPSPRGLEPMVPLDLDAICSKCLSKAPEQRYPTALALAEDLGRFLGGTPVLARRQWWVRNVWHWLRTNPIKSLVAACFLVAAGVSWKINHDEVERAQQLAASETRAVEAERTQAHEAHVAAARQGARRGDWITALEEFDRAIRDGQSDALRLRVERLTGYFALNRTGELTRELDELAEVVPIELAAQVKLMRAAWLCCDWTRAEEGRALVREALQDRQHLFSEADREFAAGLAADRVGRALEAYAGAVQADPLHYLGATSYAVALSAVGEREEARRQVAFLRGAFPDSPMPDVAEAYLAFAEGKRGEMKQHIQAMARKLTPEHQPAVVRMVELLLHLLELQEFAVRISARERLTGWEQFTLQLRLQQLQKPGRLPNREVMALPVPAVDCFRTRLVAILSASVELLPLVPAALAGQVGPDSLRRLQALTDDYPDAAVLLIAATVQSGMARRPLDSGDHRLARRHLEASADLCSRAVRAPSITPQTPVRYLALGYGMMSDVAVLKLAREPAPIHLRRVRENIHPLVADGDRWRKLRPDLIGIVVQMATAPLTADQSADWKLDEPASRSAFRKRMNDLAALILGLLDDWAIDEPDNAAIQRLRDKTTGWAASTGLVGEKNPAPPKK